jgi:hypothetical protein
LDGVDQQRAWVWSAEPATVQQLALQGVEEAFGDRVFVAVADRAHRQGVASLLATLAERQRGVLAALIGADLVFRSRCQSALDA